jgi:hypothetical protein
MGPTCASLEESVFKAATGAGAYREYRVVPQVISVPTPPIAHPPATAMAPNPLITPATDEQVLALFPRGGSELVLTATLDLTTSGVSAGAVRNCHPLTSCAEPQDIPAYGSACKDLRDGIHQRDMYLYGAKVTGPDSYALDTNSGPIAISGGVGTFAGTTVLVSKTQLQFAYPARNDAMQGGGTQETSNLTCTFPLAWH